MASEHDAALLEFLVADMAQAMALAGAQGKGTKKEFSLPLHKWIAAFQVLSFLCFLACAPIVPRVGICLGFCVQWARFVRGPAVAHVGNIAVGGPAAQ